MPGYPDNENMWVKLCNIEKDEKHTNKFPNGRSMVTVQVCDRVFKLKKNPLYLNNSKLIHMLRQVQLEEPNNQAQSNHNNEETGGET